MTAPPNVIKPSPIEVPDWVRAVVGGAIPGAGATLDIGEAAIQAAAGGAEETGGFWSDLRDTFVEIFATLALVAVGLALIAAGLWRLLAPARRAALEVASKVTP